MKINIIYSDILNVDEKLESLIGIKKFSNIIFKKKTLKQHFFEEINKLENDIEILTIENTNDIEFVNDKILLQNNNSIIIYFFSCSVIYNIDNFVNFLQNLDCSGNYCLQSNDLVGFVFTNIDDYINCSNKINKITNLKGIDVSDFCKNINNVDEFIKYITECLDTRFFNSLSITDEVITKSSKNKQKIYSEYRYYELIPEQMKKWFVKPYDYQENDEFASYKMEKLKYTDSAFYFVNGFLTEKDFSNLLKHYFSFIKQRPKKETSFNDALENFEKLYITKVIERIKKLKTLKEFTEIENYIKTGTNYDGIDEIIEKYIMLLNKFDYKSKLKNYLVISHGDLCFSNTLFNKVDNVIKLVDVKGATNEDELYLDYYYDIAKLSHSICGRYDFFNSNQFEIKKDDYGKLNLVIDFDNHKYITIFKQFILQLDPTIDYNFVRLLEASLFLSMLPLHIDYPKKVLGFILNAINIIGEIENGL